MQKIDGNQQEMVDDLLPKIDDEELEGKLDLCYKLRADALNYNKTLKEVKDKIKGFVLALSKQDQEVGKVKIGDFIIPFSTKQVEEEEVSYITNAGTKVRLKMGLEDSDGKEED